MKIQTIVIIAKKEFFSFVNSPLAYTVAVPFLFISIFIFLRAILVSGDASMRAYFDLLPWFLILIAPALSMKLLSDEWKSDTLEVLFAHPIKEAEIVFGKFLGAWAFFGLILLATIGLPVSILSYSNADPGQMVGQYLGAFLTGGMFIAVGLAASAFVKNAISSFLLSAAASFVLVIIGLDFITMLAPFPLNRLLLELSVLTHTETLARGLLDLRDIAYFASLTGLFLYAAVSKLSERMWTESPSEKLKLRTTFAVITAIGLAANILLDTVPVRLDVTRNRLFTLSAGTRETVRKVPDVVNVTVYASRNLPAEMASTVQSVADLLGDITRVSDKIKVTTRHPDTDMTAAREAASAGIQEVTFNKIGTGKFEVQSGYLGVAIRYGDKTEAVPYVQDPGDLEYQLAKKIRKLTSEKPVTVGILKGYMNQDQIVTEAMAAEYETKTIEAGAESPITDVSMLVVVDDTTLNATDAARIRTYLSGGGKALVYASGTEIDQQSLAAIKTKREINAAFEDYGLSVNDDLVYDLKLGEIITLGQGNQRYLSQYPFWFRAIPVPDSLPPLSGIQTLSVGWPSSITLTPKDGVTQKSIVTTGHIAGTTAATSVAPENASGLAANASEPVTIGAYATIDGKGSVMVVSSNLAVSDQFIGNNRDNLSFLTGAVDYLASDADLAFIPSKSAGRPVLSFRSPADIYFMQYGNLIIPPLAVIAYAVFRLRRRKMLTGRTYAAR